MLAVNKKCIKTLALLALVGAGFSFFDHIASFHVQQVFAADVVEKAPRKKGEATKKSEARNKKKEEKKLEEDSIFLKDTEKTIDYLPEIFRCPECGYEQDFAGNCPDHNTLELIKVLSPGRDPLEPAELDGNEDIIVDIPLKNLQFRKEPGPATSTKEVK